MSREHMRLDGFYQYLFLKQKERRKGKKVSRFKVFSHTAATTTF